MNANPALLGSLAQDRRDDQARIRHGRQRTSELRHELGLRTTRPLLRRLRPQPGVDQ